MRLLLPDLFVIFFIFYTLINIKNIKFKLFPINKFLFTVFTVSWMFCFFRGLLIQPGYAIGEARWYILSILVFTLPLLINNKNDIKTIFKIFILIGCFWAVVTWLMVFQILPKIGIYQYLYQEGRFNAGGKGIQFIVNALFIVLMNRKYKFIKFNFKFDSVLIVLFISAILLSGVRTALLSLVVLLLFYMLLSQNRYSSVIMIMFIVALSAILLFNFSTFSQILEYQLNYFNNFSENSSFSWRVLIWGRVLEDSVQNLSRAFWGRPMGFDQFSIQELDLLIDYSNTHNDFLAIAASIGWVGALSFFLLIINYLLALISNHNNLQSLSSFYSKVLILLLLSQVIQSMFNAEVRHYGLSLLFWVYLGMFHTIIAKFHDDDSYIFNQHVH